MKKSFKQLGHQINSACVIDEGVSPVFNKLNTIAFIGVILYITFVNVTLGFSKIVVLTAIAPLIVFLLGYYMNYKKYYGLGLLIVEIVSLFHASIVVYSYDAQYLEIMYLFIAIIPLFPIDNLKLLRILYLLSYLCFLIFGFHLKQYNLFEIAQWPVSILIYFVLMNAVFIVLYQFLIAYKKNSLKSRYEILSKNKEIQDQNDLIQLNTKLMIKFEHEKHEMELANKQKDMELLNLNNQLKIKMKNDLIKDLQKLKKSKNDNDVSIQSIINKLKHQIDEESKIDLLHNNINEVGSDFNERLKKHFHELSGSEIELLSFIKLKLSNKQIAIQKNTSPNTINVAFHRLKQKCNFETTNDLRSFIEEF